ncbi:S8 family serine peptidase [Maribacter sp. MJ134]|uniref:S8 family serine peptidase n=1 Tax=Maribacter sp. MJ134 TaxID=2496865 RepID=UPI001F4944AF|nr:S8 family serine peptidase [Maribacter sp. MJ134]
MNYQIPESKMYTSISIILLFILICPLAFGQSEKLKSLIDKEYDFSKIGAMHVDLEFDFEDNRKKTLALAKINNWKVKEVLADGKKIELQEVGTDGSPIFYETYAEDASQTSRASTLHTNGLLELDLDGAGMQVGVWDSGVALTTHQEYDIRATVADGSNEIDAHATMVTGSIISSGIKKEAKGVAHAANVLSHDWTRDKIEVTEAAANGLLLSNHSYGIKTDRVPDWYFGSYIKVSQDWDRIMYNAPYYLMVTAAGNAQNRRDNDAPIFGTSSDGFDLMLGFTIAKNGLTIAGANTKVDRKGNLKEAEVSPYSSFGPVDDGRIKPDLAGDGSSIVSTYATSNTSYNASSGTSMATPGVTGALLLLQQYNEQLYGSYLKAATLKGLALHTADDVAQAGPDYKMGWGIMNAKKAAEALINKDYTTHISEENLEDGATFTFTVTANGNETLAASISWTDPESEYINRGVVNDKRIALVNDLDVRITQDGKTFFPWKLNPIDPKAGAKQGDNLVDPFERIDIPNAKGTYTITVSHKGALKNNAQDFSLLISGAKMNHCSIATPDGLALDAASTNEITTSWNGTLDALYEVQYKNENEDQWITEYVTNDSFVLKDLLVNENYILRVRTFCSQNIASEYTDEYRFTFLGESTVVGPLDFNETFNKDAEVNFSVYPNPAANEIRLNTEVADTAMYSIVSSSGIELKTGSAKNAQINVADLATGLYIIQVQDLGSKKSAKFFKY